MANINGKVAQHKEKHPEAYCPVNRCLWRTAKLNYETRKYEGGGYCPRHARTFSSSISEAAGALNSLATEMKRRAQIAEDIRTGTAIYYDITDASY